MMRFFSLIIVSTLALFNKSCVFSGCEKVNFNQEDLSWYKSLSDEGDTLFYKGSDGSVHTFIIDNKYNEFSKCNKFEFGAYQYGEFRYSGTFLDMRGKGVATSDYFDINFTKNHQIDSISSCNKMIQVFDLYFEGVTSFELFTQDTILVKSLNKNVPTIFIDKSKHTKERGSSDIRVRSFNWSKKYGLVRYMTEDSVVYEYWKQR